MTVQDPHPETVKALLERGRRLRSLGDWSGVAAAYRALVRIHPGTPSARSALIPLAQLELEQLGQVQSALLHCREYLSGGEGPLRLEARQCEAKALERLGRGAEELAARRGMELEFPSSLAAERNRLRIRVLEGSLQD